MDWCIFITLWKTVPKLLLPLGVCFGLSACVSSILSSASQINRVDDGSDFNKSENQTLTAGSEQPFFHAVDYNHLPVPSRSPALFQDIRTPSGITGLVTLVKKYPVAVQASVSHIPSRSIPFLSTMPGVKSDSEIFGVVDRNRNAPNTRLASIPAMVQSSPYELRVQNKNVKIGCIHPEVIKIVRIVERHYGKRAIVTSGYRDRSFNRRAGGA